MSEALRLLPGIDPDALIKEAILAHKPIASYCLFSGGHDSTVLAHRCKGLYDKLMHIDTGTAVPGVREYVQEYADWLDKPLTVYDAGDAFRRMVLERQGPNIDTPLGFPGPAQHGRAYTRLKERQIEALVRDAKVGRSRMASVMLLTGKRRAESARRAKTTLGIDKRGGQLYVNPLIDWTAHDMRRYRAEHELPESPVAALLHRSGECNCGSFAATGEREMLQSLWPEWFERTIASLEREAESQGVAACRWGTRPDQTLLEQIAKDRAAGLPEPDIGPMCSSCEFRLFDPDAA